jgi:hypothetical protein
MKVASLNTALLGLQKLIQQKILAFIALQETKLTTIKSTKYLTRIFPKYKLIFNNLHKATTCCNKREPNYIPLSGGIMTLIHENHFFLGNLQKIATPNTISLYLQIIEIKKRPSYTTYYN